MIKSFRKPLLAVLVTVYMTFLMTSPAVAGTVSSFPA